MYVYSAGAALGINDSHLNDQYMSSEIFRGLMFSANVAFRAKSASDSHEAEAFYSSGKPDFRNEDWNAIETLGYITYGYTRNIKTTELWGNQLIISAGGGISSFILSNELRKTDKPTGETMFFDQSWYWAHNLNLIFGSDYNLNKHKILLRISMPVFKIVTRPENGHNLNNSNKEVINDSFLNAATKGKSEYFWESPALNFQLGYSLPLSNYLDLNARYLFSYISADEPEPSSMGMYVNNIMIGMGLNF